MTRHLAARGGRAPTRASWSRRRRSTPSSPAPSTSHFGGDRAKLELALRSAGVRARGARSTSSPVTSSSARRSRRGCCPAAPRRRRPAPPRRTSARSSDELGVRGRRALRHLGARLDQSRPRAERPLVRARAGSPRPRPPPRRLTTPHAGPPRPARRPRRGSRRVCSRVARGSRCGAADVVLLGEREHAADPGARRGRHRAAGRRGRRARRPGDRAAPRDRGRAARRPRGGGVRGHRAHGGVGGRRGRRCRPRRGDRGAGRARRTTSSSSCVTGSWDLPGARLLDLVAVMDRLRSPGRLPVGRRADPRVARRVPRRGGLRDRRGDRDRATTPRCARSSATCCSRWCSTPASPRSTTEPWAIDDVADGHRRQARLAPPARLRRRRRHAPPSRSRRAGSGSRPPRRVASRSPTACPVALPSLVLAAKLLERVEGRRARARAGLAAAACRRAARTQVQSTASVRRPAARPRRPARATAGVDADAGAARGGPPAAARGSAPPRASSTPAGLASHGRWPSARGGVASSA